MPFKSQAQRGFMYANHPKMAKEFEEATPKGKELPEHVKKMADGGMVQNPDMGVSIDPNYQPSDPNEPGLETPPEVLAALAAIIGMPGGRTAIAKVANQPEMMGAPEMEGVAGQVGKPWLRDVDAFSKGTMGKGTPNEMNIWGVRGDPKEIAKMGFGKDPGSMPEAILRERGALPDVRTIQSAPGRMPDNPANQYLFAHGGEVKPMEKRGMKEEAGNYAFGGETNPKHETLSAMQNNPSAGFANGGDVMSALQQLAAPFKPLMAPAQMAGAASMNPTIQGAVGRTINSLVPGSNPMPQPETPPQSNVDEAFINRMFTAPNGGMAQESPAPRPQTPSIGDMTEKMNQTPPTDYNFYKDISSEDRAKLYQQLTQQQKSPGSMIASGLGGLGDAIARSYGGQNTNYQKDIMANQQAQKEGALGALDTQRQQKMQDLQGQMAMQKADPKSPVSQGYRQIFKQITGKQPGSNMSAAMIEATFPEYAKIIDAQLTAGASRMGHEVEAAKNIEGGGMFQGLKNMFNPAEKQAQTRLGELAGVKPQAGQSQAGWGMKRVK
jgi:hypothetical protein